MVDWTIMYLDGTDVTGSTHHWRLYGKGERGPRPRLAASFNTVWHCMLKCREATNVWVGWCMTPTRVRDQHFNLTEWSD